MNSLNSPNIPLKLGSNKLMSGFGVSCPMFRLKTIAGILFIRDLQPGLTSMFSSRPSVWELEKKTLGTNALDVQEFYLSTWLILSRESVRDAILHRLLFLSFPQKFSTPHKS